MVERQLRARGIDDERVLAAMARVPRELFVAEELRAHAYDDAALPIGGGQTISQPYMVARICSELSLRGNERVIAVAAAAPGIPPSLYEQLEERGRLVVPVGGRSEQLLQVVVRLSEGSADH